MEDLQQAVPVLDKQSLKEDCKKLSRLHFEDETFIETLERLSHVVHPMLKRGERQYLNWGGVMSHIKNSNNSGILCIFLRQRLIIVFINCAENQLNAQDRKTGFENSWNIFVLIAVNIS